MMQLFLESLLSGALLASVVAGGGALARRLARPGRGGLPDGQALRCVRPLDLSAQRGERR
jgi:hypothetical protein